MGVFIFCCMIGSIGIDVFIKTLKSRTRARQIVTTISVIPAVIFFSILAGVRDISGLTFIGLIVASYGPVAWGILSRDPGKVYD